MKLKALSNYNNDKDTRYGDCILIIDTSFLTIYDCGHEKHAGYIESFLEKQTNISNINIVVSHNDSDHTAGVICLLKWLSEKNKYTVKVYTHQYTNYVEEIKIKIDDGRRKNLDKIEEDIIKKFSNIDNIINTAEKYGFETIDAKKGTIFDGFKVVGPTKSEFIEVVAKALDNRETDTVGEGDENETVMNAASVQLEFDLTYSDKVLLCGDATPMFLNNLEEYTIIQLPHHGQLDDAKSIFDKIDELDSNDDSYSKKYLISDNSGSSENSGGSDELVKYMEEYNYQKAYNTKNGIVELPKLSVNIVTNERRRGCLGDLDSI